MNCCIRVPDDKAIGDPPFGQTQDESVNVPVAEHTVSFTGLSPEHAPLYKNVAPAAFKEQRLLYVCDFCKTLVQYPEAESQVVGLPQTGEYTAVDIVVSCPHADFILDTTES